MNAEHHFRDADDNPAGGTSFGRGYCISWQNGPLGRGDERKEPDGATVEDILYAAQERLEFYQRSRFKCPENWSAIEAISCALACLMRRTRDRVERDVEGTHEV